MKKTVAVIIAVVLVACVFAACASEEPVVSEIKTEAVEDTSVQEPADETSEEATEEVSGEGFVYATSDGQAIDIMDDADAILAALGDPISSFEADSCAFQGKDLFYYYDGYQLTVNDVNGTNKITAVTLVDDTVVTPEGIKIGDDEGRIEELYGTGYGKDGNIYVFKAAAKDGGEKQLRIKAENGKVTSVIYTYATEGNEE